MKDRDESPAHPNPVDEIEDEQYEEEEHCLYCGVDLSESETHRRYRVCPQCGFHHSISARQRISLLADPGSFKEVHGFLTSIDPLSFSGREPYEERIHEAQRRTGLTEAVITGVCTIGGNPTVIAVLDFGFMGGNMGGVVGEKVALAFELATKRKIPMISVVSSGGARVQEGVLSLMQMAKTAAAAKRLHAKRLPHISILTNPTSGEVYASFANLGDVILAEPEAMMGFAGPRVIKNTIRAELPEGFQTAEFMLEKGFVDRIVPRANLGREIARVIDYCEK